MKKRRNFRKKPKDTARGLSVNVFNNNVDGALRILKKKLKSANLFQDLRKKEYYEKPSDTKRHKKQMAKLRNKYAIEKEKESKKY